MCVLNEIAGFVWGKSIFPQRVRRHGPGGRGCRSSACLGCQESFFLNYPNHNMDAWPLVEIRSRLIFLFRFGIPQMRWVVGWSPPPQSRGVIQILLAAERGLPELARGHEGAIAGMGQVELPFTRVGSGETRRGACGLGSLQSAEVRIACILDGPVRE